jgi:cysteine sulfinate desulfinase/cysteine desulfurase-like protein
MPPIYLDYNATTPIDPVVFAAMEPYLRDYFGNPSSDHAYGERTREAISRAREQVAALIGAEPETIVFTGSGSEANNLALKGVALTYRAHGNHIITSAIEHPAITAPHTLNISFPGVNAAALLATIRAEVACSTGSACHAGHAEPSAVLLAMGRDATLAAAALRLSLSWQTTSAEIEHAAACILAAIQQYTILHAESTDS